MYLDPIGRVQVCDLMLLFQPQMSSDGATVACVEALVRQRHPVKGLLSAADVLRSLRTAARREVLDWWVLGEACRHQERWQALPISVNVCATQFRRFDFAKRALRTIETLGADPRRLEFEILEAAFIRNFDAAVANIQELRAAGVRVALDDFGTGYSSLSYLLRLPIDKLKIDKSFVDGIGTVQASSIIQALVALARAIGLKVTAEGVETEEQHRFLRAIGVHYLQGYLFSRPVPAEKIDELLLRCARPRAAA